MARKTEIALLMETQNNLLPATSQNGRDDEGFSGRYIFSYSLPWGFGAKLGAF